MFVTARHELHANGAADPALVAIQAIGDLAYNSAASRQRSSGVNHDAHLAGAIAGIAFVAVTDPAVFSRALQVVFGR